MKIHFFSVFILFIAHATSAQVPAADLMAKAKCKDNACAEGVFKANGYKLVKTDVEEDIGKTYYYATDTVGGLKDFYMYEPRPGMGDNTFTFYTFDKAKFDAVLKGFTDLGFVELKSRSTEESQAYRNDKQPDYMVYSVLNKKATGDEYILMLTYFLPD